MVLAMSGETQILMKGYGGYKMYTRERIKEVVEECLQYYTMGDNKTDKEEKENFVESVMMELDNSNTILIGKEKK